jgi:hypothetical protein
LERLRGDHGLLTDAAGSAVGQASHDTNFAPIPPHVPDSSKDTHASPSSKHNPITARASVVIPCKAVAGAAPSAKVLLHPAPIPAPAPAAQMWHAGPSNLGKPMNGAISGNTHAVNGAAPTMLAHNPPSAYLALPPPHAADYWARAQAPHPQQPGDAPLHPSTVLHHPQPPVQLHLQQRPQPPPHTAPKPTPTPPPHYPLADSTHHMQPALPPQQHSPPAPDASVVANSNHSSNGADTPPQPQPRPFQVVRCERLLHGEVVLVQGVMDGQLYQGCLNLIGPYSAPAVGGTCTASSRAALLPSDVLCPGARCVC